MTWKVGAMTDAELSGVKQVFELEEQERTIREDLTLSEGGREEPWTIHRSCRDHKTPPECHHAKGGCTFRGLSLQGFSIDTKTFREAPPSPLLDQQVQTFPQKIILWVTVLQMVFIPPQILLPPGNVGLERAHGQPLTWLLAVLPHLGSPAWQQQALSLVSTPTKQQKMFFFPS